MAQAPAFANDKPAINVLTLVQQSPEHGDVVVTVSNAAVRFDAARTDTTVVAKAPTWQISVYSKERKSEFLTSYDDFDKIGFSNLRGVARRVKNDKLGTQSTPSKMFGIECKTFRLIDQKPTGMAPRVLDSMLYMGKNKQPEDRAHNTDIVVTSEKYPPQIVAILTRLYDIPLGEGLPIAAVETFKDGHARFNLKTKSISKAAVASNYFDSPIGYSKVRAFSDVTHSAKSQKNAEDIFQSLGVGEDFGTKSK